MSSQEPPAASGTPDSKTGKHMSTEHLKQNLAKRAARGGLITMSSHGIKLVVTMAATIVMARLLTPGDYGLIAMVVVLTNYMTMFKDMGLSLATVQRPEISHEQVSTLFWVNVGLSVVITLITILLAPGLAYFYGEPRLVLITFVIALGFILGGLSVQHEALLKRQMRFLALAGISTVALIMGYVVGIVMAWRGAGYWAIVASQLSLIGTNTIGAWVISGWIPGLPHRHSGVRPMLAFGRNITGYATINVFAKNFDTLMLGRYWGAQNVGLYNKASLLLSIPADQTNEPFNSVAIPALSRLSDAPERYREAYARILEKVALLTMPAIAFLIAASDWLVFILLGPQWTASARLLMVLGIAGLFQPIINTVSWLFITQGRTRDLFQWSMISAPLSIFTIVVGLPWGPLGVATSYAAGRLLLIDHLLYWFVGRRGPVRATDIYKTVAPIAVASLIGLGVALLFRQTAHVQNAFLGSAVSLAIIGLTTYVVLFLIPAGRRMLSDIKNLGRMLIGRAENPVT
jgi:PST family polysaccharide transporter